MSYDERKDNGLPEFKKCSTCPQNWPTRIAFLEDKNVRIIGYQPSFKDLAKGYVLFLCPCDTTLGLRVKDFDDLYTGPRYTELKTGKEGCGGHCLKEHDIEDCDNDCAGAYVRKIMQIIRDWDKK